MGSPLIDLVEKSYMKPSIPLYHIGDTVDVRCRIVEGSKERIQTFNGVVIAEGGKGVSACITVRRIVGNEGVERKFPLHSPNVIGIDIKRRGKVRRAKLYFLRDRIGKARKLRELRVQHKKTAKPALASASA